MLSLFHLFKATTSRKSGEISGNLTAVREMLGNWSKNRGTVEDSYTCFRRPWTMPLFEWICLVYSVVKFWVY